MEQELVTYPTWERYMVLSQAMSRLSVRERRHLFQLVRLQETPQGDIFFPTFGFTLSEFAVWYTLGEGRRKQ